MNNHEFSNYISNLIVKSMLYEVSTTPKPGLVDRANPGAHKDMDFFTFINSSVIFYEYFYNCVKMGLEFHGNDYTKLLSNIRPIGIEAEYSMFHATNNINTHKGLVFSFGIMGSAVGSLYNENKEQYFSPIQVSERVKIISQGVTKEITDPTLNKNITYGEKLYNKYKTTCIRGEVESGFETVINYSLPVIEKLIEVDKYHINDICVEVLLHLIVHTTDCNILGRHNKKTLKYAQSSAKKLLEEGGYLSVIGKKDIIDMDQDFIKRNISPGGAADLLAITLMFYFLNKGDKGLNNL